ncbi:PAS domain S-box protein [Phenylobacterium sp.]|uniref:sensor histidine kinase n=1 Tax=Phenylobacterium sp. TaxID=1871053 RepID=UPI0028109D14|nr:PAS domain S-box protein [Phenylobacterium sp.]
MAAPANILMVTAGDPATARRRIPHGRATDVLGLQTLQGEPPSVVVVDAAVERQSAVGREAVRRWPGVKIVFLAPPERLQRLQSSLPFMPELAGALAVSDELTDANLLEVVNQLAQTAEHDRAISGLYQRLNSEVERFGAAKSVLHERHRQLVLAERYLATVLDHAPQALISTDLEGVVVTCNQVAADVFGAAAGDCAGLLLTEQFAEASRATVQDAIRTASEGRSARREVRIARAAGDMIVDFGVAPVLGTDGRVAALSIALLDVTDRRRIEAELAETNRRLNAVLNNASVSIFLMDERQHCAYMNEAAEKLTGYTWAETQGRPLHDVIHHTHPDGRHYPIEDCPIDRAFPENHQQQGEDVFIHKDGHFYHVAFTASPIRDEDSRTIGTIIEVRDISEEKRNEQARELLMREVDHRARNVLTVAQSMVQLTQAPDLDAFREALLGRISALARAQSSLSKTSWQGARIKDVVCEELETFGREGAYDASGPEILLPAEQVQPLSMIVHELATNAAKYGAFSHPSGHIAITWSQDPAQHIRLDWRETGGAGVRPPTREGFGSRLITQLAKQLSGEVEFDWRPEGLRLTLHADGRHAKPSA